MLLNKIENAYQLIEFHSLYTEELRQGDRLPCQVFVE